MINELAEKVLCKQLLYKPNTNTIKTNTVKASFDFSGQKPFKNFFYKNFLTKIFSKSIHYFIQESERIF
jgi:hypothetical protein